MRHETTLALNVIICLLYWGHANGQEFESFYAKHITAVEDYLMTGHGRTWGSCDLLLLGRFQYNMSGNVPFIVADSTIDFDIEPALSSSHCLGKLTCIYDVQKTEARLCEKTQPHLLYHGCW